MTTGSGYINFPDSRGRWGQQRTPVSLSTRGAEARDQSEDPSKQTAVTLPGELTVYSQPGGIEQISATAELPQTTTKWAIELGRPAHTSERLVWIARV